MEFRLLGPLEVASGGRQLALGGPKQRALLGYLLLHANEVVARERLVEALWGDEPPERATNAVQVHVHGLRRLLGRERLETRGSGYALRVEPGELDLERFRSLVARSRSADGPERAESLRSALALWRGSPLADLAEAPFAPLEQARLEEARLEATELRIDAELTAGRHAAVVADLERLVAAHPYRERLRHRLMLALYRSGRQADALESFRQARRTLRDDLGIEPGEELQELERAILRQDASLAATAPRHPAPRTLPAPVTPLLGRGLELAALGALLAADDVRLVTITGPGGIGKTRVALGLGEEARELFPGGVAFVELAPVADAELVASTVAHSLGIDQAPASVPEAVARELGDTQTLLVLDNFEHVLPAAALVSDLLRRAPAVKVLVTSRSVLGLAGEHEYPLPPLPLPSVDRPPDPLDLARNAAVTLFVARARAAKPDFRLTASNAGTVARICIALDGLPLALELAAARVKLLSPEAILERLAGGLDVLATAGPDRPARQQTLRGTIEWSYRLLEPDERRLFSRLAVFAGGFAVEAAEAVCDADLETLASLVDKSLVVADSSGPEPRFHLLETIREYARERLEESGEAAAIRGRHADHFVALAEEAEQAVMAGTDPEAWLARVEREHDNAGAALRWLGDSGAAAGELRLAAALGIFWRLRGHLSDGRRRLDEAIGRAADADRRLVARALEASAGLAFRQGDNDRTRVLTDESLAAYQEVGDSVAAARMLHELGSIAFAEGDYERAMPLYEQSVELVRAIGDTRRYAVGLANLGALANEMGELERAAELQDQALVLQREVGDKDGTTITLHNQARTELRRGRRERAHELLGESLRLAQELGYAELIAYCLEGFGELTAEADAERAGRLLGAADALFGRLGVPLQGSEREGYERTVDELRRRLGEDGFAAAAAAGSALDEEQAAALALAEP